MFSTFLIFEQNLIFCYDMGMFRGESLDMPLCFEKGYSDEHRGTFVSHFGVVNDVYRKNVLIDSDWIYIGNILEYRIHKG